MPTSTYARIAPDERTALGIFDATQTDDDLIYGVSQPKRPRVFKRDGSNIISTYCDPDALDELPAGWASSSASKVKR
jgi:hypothetical protein